MGNRAFIYFRSADIDTGIYLHYNGGRDSVGPFLEYCQLRGFRFDDYGVARMAQVIGNFFGGDLSIGVQSTKGESPSAFDPGDNGVYIIDRWDIVGRYPRQTIEQHHYDRLAMLLDINSAQPERDQLPEETIRKYVEESVAK